ncbi:MAG: hypothetical protein EBR82_86655 [Caulobacteraceae bacterium]|nr:hypothetical protein [Caulobacteraceae bacterium]
MIKNRTDFIMGVGFVYYDDKGRRYVFDTKKEMTDFINELAIKKKKEKQNIEKKKADFFKPQIELLHRKGIGI